MAKGRKKVNPRKDKKIFIKTANRRVPRPSLMRGGNMS